jgi:hypothetical protein
MSLYPTKPRIGRKVQTDVDGRTDNGLLAVEVAIGSPALGTATFVHAAVTLADGATTTVTTAITNPDVPRNVTAKGNAAGISGNAVFTGTDMNGDPITDTIALVDATEVAGTKAFKTVTQIVLPARNAPGDTVSIGQGAKLGLPFKQTRNRVLAAYLNNTREGTMPTVVADNDELEKNVATLSSALNGNPVHIVMLAEG